jgi:HEAT repeat protein
MAHQEGTSQEQIIGSGTRSTEPTALPQGEAFRNHVDLRIGLLGDEKASIRLGVANSLSKEVALPSELHSPLIEALLAENSPGVIAPLVRAILKTGVSPESLVAPLTTLLHHDRLMVAEEAAHALGGLLIERALPFLPMFLTARDEETECIRLAFARGLEERGSTLTLAEFLDLEDRIEEQPNKDITDQIRESLDKPREELLDNEIAYVLLAATRVDSRGVKREAMKALQNIIDSMDGEQKMALAPAIIWAAPAWMSGGSSIQYRALEMLQDCREQLPYSGRALLPIEEGAPPQMQAYQAYAACLLGGEAALQIGVEFLSEVAWSYSAEESERAEAIQYLGSICHFAQEEDAATVFVELASMVRSRSDLPLPLKIEALDTFGHGVLVVDESLQVLSALSSSNRTQDELRYKACQMLGELPYQNSEQKNQALRILHYLHGEPDEELSRKAGVALERLSLSSYERGS